MPRDRDNNFTYTDNNNIETKKPITASWFNQRFDDIKNGIDASLKRDGDSSQLNWVMDSDSQINNLSLGNPNSLLTNKFLTYVFIMDIFESTSIEINFNDYPKFNLIVIDNKDPIVININTISVNLGSRINGEILGIVTTNCNATNLVVTPNVSKVNSIGTYDAIYFQKFESGFKEINTANININSSDKTPNVSIGTQISKSLKQNFITPINQQTNVFSTSTAPSSTTTAKSIELRLIDGVDFNINVGDLLVQVSSPAMQISSLNQGLFSYFNNNSYPTYLYCGTNETGSKKIYTVKEITKTTGHFSFLEINLDLDFDNKMYAYNGFKDFNIPDSNASFPIAKIGTTIPVSANLSNLYEIEVTFKDLNVFLNGDLIADEKNTINNPIIAIVDSELKAMQMDASTSINFGTLSDFNSDFLDTVDYQNYNGVTTSYNGAYITDGFLVIGHNNTKRTEYYEPFASNVTNRKPLDVWSMPSSSNFNGTIRFTRVSNNVFKISGNATSKFNSTSGKPYGRTSQIIGNPVNKNTFINLEFNGTTTITKSDIKLIIISYPVGAINSANNTSKPQFHSENNDLKPQNASALGNNDGVKVQFGRANNSIFKDNGNSSCFENGNIGVVFKENI